MLHGIFTYSLFFSASACPAGQKRLEVFVVIIIVSLDLL